MDHQQTLAGVGEDALLAQIFPHYATDDPRMLLGPGDDAAVLAAPDGRVVITTDTMVRGQDWRDDWSSGDHVGAKLVTQNVADLAAMGAVPTGLVVTLVADPATPVAWAVAVSRGIARQARAYGVPVVGGDLSSAPEGFVSVSITATGDLQGRTPVLRSGARVGDVVVVCGRPGPAGGGLALLMAGITARPESTWTAAEAELVAAQRVPTSPIAQGPVAAAGGASAMLDLSDGLVRDAGRVAAASGVTIDLDTAALLPYAEGALTQALGSQEALTQVLTAGEGHALLATCAPDAPLAAAAGWRVIGRVVAARRTQRGDLVRVTRDGAPVGTGGGWDHFER